MLRYAPDNRAVKVTRWLFRSGAAMAVVGAVLYGAGDLAGSRWVLRAGIGLWIGAALVLAVAIGRYERQGVRWVVAAGFLAAAQPGDARELEAVAYPIDGDTLQMQSGEVVRLENVDTPEMKCQCPSECRRALAAFSFARNAVGQGVELRRRMTRDGRLAPDRNGRTIARVILPDGRDLGELLISRGLGRPYHGERRQSWCP